MPLRSDDFPDGFHWLSGSDKLRTEAANVLYEHTVLLAQTAVDLSIAISIENPSNSLMWKTTPFKNFLDRNPQLRFINFHNCAHGGTRDKRTSFLTNVEWFDSLQLFCNKQHSHAPWTPVVIDGRVSFPTHSEAAYPEILCQRIASLLRQEMLNQGACDVDSLHMQTKSHGKSLNRVVLGSLPRGKHVKPLVSEFGTYVNAITPVQSDDLLQNFLQTLPKGSSIQLRLLTTWGTVRDAVYKQIKKKDLEEKLAHLKASQNQTKRAKVDDVYANLDSRFGCQPGSNYKFLCNADEMDENVCEKVVIAIPREPLDFMHRAVDAGHPRSLAISLPSELQTVVQWNRDAPALEIYRHRIDFFKRWTARATELRAEDERLLNTAPVHLRSLLKGKRLALWQDMLTFYEYPDKELVNDIIKGFPVTGWLPDSQVFPKDFKPPSIDVSTLKTLSKGFNENVRSKVLASASSELTMATWEETERELREGWMELDDSGGKDAAWAMRFGLQQKDKVRVIDDFSIAAVNHTTGLQEKLKIFGIDDIAALLAYSLDTCETAEHPIMLGKTMDLKSAYKQFGICSADRECIRVVTCRPSTKDLVVLLVNALPFGATGSVSGFLRVSMFLWFLGMMGLRLAWTCFYDDYTMVSRTDCTSNAGWAAECLFDLLGILYAKEGKKATCFDKIFGTLGVIFDLTSLCKKSFSLTHTSTRREELVETLKELLQSQTFTSKAVERLRGRMLWYENFVCGRQANILVARLGRYINNSKGPQFFDHNLRETLIQLLERVQNGAPVVVNSRVLSTWVCFTDGACEDRASVGAMLVNPFGQAIGVFGDALPSELQNVFYSESKHPIYEVELLPVLISVFVWGDLMKESQVVFYLDNESAKAGLIKGYGATKVANAIVGCFCQTESLLQLKTWFSRVPTHSNPSDGPSRMCFDLPNSLGCSRHTVPWIEISKRVIARLDQHGAMAGRA